MNSVCSSLLAIYLSVYGIVSVECLNLRRNQQRSKFFPVQGRGAKLKATLDGICKEDYYWPSELEKQWNAHVLEWTGDQVSLCQHMHRTKRRAWLGQNRGGIRKPGMSIFSKLCKKGKPPQLIEPLAGILRDPRMICNGVEQRIASSTDWLVLADQGRPKAAPQGMRANSLMPSLRGRAPSVNERRQQAIFFDAGGTRFMDAMNYFTSQYESRGIEFDNIYVWEAVFQGDENYWDGTPTEIRSKWKPRLKFYDGVPVSAGKNAENNPLNVILAECQPDDFCAFKLDIDTPSVELPLVEQLIESPAVAEVLDEFFFEHHVAGVMQYHGWGYEVNGTFEDSYRIFSRLRKMGVRAHSWI